MTEFAHITPTAYLDLFAADRPFHLTLAHLIEEDPVYTNWYAQRDLSRGMSPYVNIMDNSAFEMYKQGREMYPSDKLIEMGTKVGADYIVMSDYPGQPSQVTIDKAVEMAPELREAGFGTFFVPQSSEGDLEDLIDAFDWASKSEHVDYIGVSILAVPIAYGVEKDNKLQRFLSRWKFMQELEERGILDNIKDNGKKIHFLGMVDGPNECTLVQEYLWSIDTWDSSAAVWAGMCGIDFDNSPSGLTDGKNEIEVDFGHDTGDVQDIVRAINNIKVIDNQLPGERIYEDY
jgi:hypothetical protein|tara:strand:+ start:151 stop:1017 length:867 start_codon:yes stop_codon:yes gene_type:complete